MKNIIILSLIFSTTLFAASEADLQAALATKNCLAKLKLEINEYKNIPSYYLKTDLDKRPLESVYTELQEREEDYFKTLSVWRESYNKEANNLTELGVMISSLEKENPLTEKLQSILSQEETFLRLIHSHELIYKERTLALNKAIENCSSNIEFTNDLQNDLKTFSGRLSQIKAVIAKSKSKRSLLFETSKKAIALELKRKYAQKAQMDLNDLGKKLSSMKLAMDLNTEMDNYFRSMTQAKISYTTLLNIYLQYEAPLAMIRSAIAKGEEFRKRIENLSLTPDANQVMTKNLEQYLTPLTRALNDTLTGGPEKKLERQKFMIGEYKKVATQLAPICLPAIVTYENSPSENAYALIVDTCKKAVTR